MTNDFDNNLEYVSNTLQILSFILLMRDLTNKDLSKKLDKVIEQNDLILDKLDKLVKEWFLVYN